MVHSLTVFGLTLLAATQAAIIASDEPALNVLPQATKTATKCRDLPIELGIVLDSSSSIWPPDFEFGKSFLQDLVRSFVIGPDQTRVSIILFGNGVYSDMAFNLSSHATSDELVGAIGKLKHQFADYTDTGAGIDYMREHQLADGIVRPGITKVAVVFTDGNSQDGEATAEAAEKALADGIHMIAVGVGREVNDDELSNIAGGNNSRVIRAENFEKLVNVLGPLQQKICEPITTTTTTTTTTTVAPVTMSIDINDLLGNNVDCQEDPIELSFVVDSSTSIYPPDFDLAKKFVQESVEYFDVGPTKTRVSIVLFGNGVYTEEAFDLNTYSSKKEILGAIGELEYQAGDFTSTGVAIDYMRNHQLSQGVSRAGLPRVCVLITDGNSQDTNETAEAAAKAASDGIHMIAVGVGKEVNDQELLNIAAGNKSRVIRAENFASLKDLVKPLRRKICAPNAPPTEEAVKDVACGKAKPADVYFVFSQSALGLGDTIWTSEFISRVVSSNEMAEGFRYGIISDSCDEGFELGTYQSAEPILHRLDKYEEFKLPSLTHKLVLTGYPPSGEECGAEAKRAKVAVIFSTRDQKGLAQVEEHVKILQADGVKVFLVDPSVHGAELAGAETLNGPSNIALADEFISKLC